MAIVDTLTKHGFVCAFQRVRPDNFTYAGLEALYDYLDDYSEQAGHNIEFDPIAFCCEYTEYENLAEFHDNYDSEEYPDMESIGDSTIVIPIDGTDSFIIECF